ncbi:hypothetical protein AAFF_G00265370 [Aldrovandia affinis]|uniref:Uncharacterized protein n=1 Tax=Aldrovandia affinis TaxID=143900 RepID=A0AAD7RC41_9TELE|nr:hypothetical protein AAFF_G00265370 [Aldrovandia affinis]
MGVVENGSPICRECGKRVMARGGTHQTLHSTCVSVILHVMPQWKNFENPVLKNEYHPSRKARSGPADPHDGEDLL